MTNLIGPGRCESCAHSRKHKQGGDVLYCHRYPPTPLTIPQRDGRMVTLASWSPVAPDDHCGEYSRLVRADAS